MATKFAQKFGVVSTLKSTFEKFLPTPKNLEARKRQISPIFRRSPSLGSA